MIFTRYVDYQGNGLSNRQLNVSESKNKGIRINIWWYRIPSEGLTASEINKRLDTLTELKGIVPDKGNTVSSLTKIQNSFFYWKKFHCICGTRDLEDGRIELFRLSHKAQQSEGEAGALESWNLFNEVYQKYKGKKVDQNIKGLPQELHKFRSCCPKPIDWLDEYYAGKVLRHVNKADISSAYGYQLTNTLLPDCRFFKLVEGFKEPTEEYPFVFYLRSNNMAIWQEGDTYNWEKDRYATAAKKGILYQIPKEDEVSLMLKGTNYELSDVINFLYEGRKEHPEYKNAMNITIGWFDRKKESARNIIRWPIRAAIIYRCNERILSLIRSIIADGGIPILINTDSISWLYDADPTEERKLGAFIKEYTDCEFLGIGPKKYQIKSGDEVLTRYAGPRKEYTSQFAFGDLLKPEVVQKLKEIELEHAYIWSNDDMRFMNAEGGIYYE